MHKSRIYGGPGLYTYAIVHRGACCACTIIMGCACEVELWKGSYRSSLKAHFMRNIIPSQQSNSIGGFHKINYFSDSMMLGGGGGSEGVTLIAHLDFCKMMWISLA